MPDKPHARRYPLILLGIFVLWWIAWAIHPADPTTWWLENILTFAAIIALILSFRFFPLSGISYTCIFIHISLHIIGAHYTYSHVPYKVWIDSMLGTSLASVAGAGHANIYDRIMHFAFGLLWAYPIREVFCRIADAKGFWGYYLPLDLTMSFSMLYELMEWGTAVIFGGAPEFLGTQGDPWDAQKDMALATVGALIAMFVVAMINWIFDKNFGNEWRTSLRVKHQEPLGEVALKQKMSR